MTRCMDEVIQRKLYGRTHFNLGLKTYGQESTSSIDPLQAYRDGVVLFEIDVRSRHPNDFILQFSKLAHVVYANKL